MRKNMIVMACIAGLLAIVAGCTSPNKGLEVGNPPETSEITTIRATVGGMISIACDGVLDQVDIDHASCDASDYEWTAVAVDIKDVDDNFLDNMNEMIVGTLSDAVSFVTQSISGEDGHIERERSEFDDGVRVVQLEIVFGGSYTDVEVAAAGNKGSKSSAVGTCHRGPTGIWVCDEPAAANVSDAEVIKEHICDPASGNISGCVFAPTGVVIPQGLVPLGGND